MISFKGRHFPKDVILMAVRWKVAYPLSYRQIEEMMEERGVELDHSIVQKWVVHYAPQLESAFRSRKRAVGSLINPLIPSPQECVHKERFAKNYAVVIRP